MFFFLNKSIIYVVQNMENRLSVLQQISYLNK